MDNVAPAAAAAHIYSDMSAGFRDDRPVGLELLVVKAACDDRDVTFENDDVIRDPIQRVASEPTG